MPITNNIGVKVLLMQHIPKDVATRHIMYDSDLDRLLRISLNKLQETDPDQYVSDQLVLMAAVRDHHTYIQRIGDLIRYGLT